MQIVHAVMCKDNKIAIQSQILEENQVVQIVRAVMCV
jgi:hypothetical protein